MKRKYKVVATLLPEGKYHKTKYYSSYDNAIDYFKNELGNAINLYESGLVSYFYVVFSDIENNKSIEFNYDTYQEFLNHRNLG